MAFLRILGAILLVVAADSAAAGPPCPESCRRLQVNETNQSQTAAFQRWGDGPVSYLFSEKEKKIADALIQAGASVTAQQRAAFRDWFWERRDPSPGTHVNEFRRTFEDRVDYVNKEFGDASSTLPGWQTPRGAVYVLLGPPTRVEVRAGHLYGEFDDTTIEVWIYELDDASVLEVPFVSTDHGVVLLTGPDNLSMRGRLDAALARAVTGCIHNRDLPFTGTSPFMDDVAAGGWPATGSVRRTDQGIEGQATVPLAELYGSPDGDDLRIDLRFDLLDAETDARKPLGEVTIVIGPDDFGRWHDRELTVALWFPDDGGSAGIVMTEVVSGRSAPLVETARSDAIARAYAVEHLLGGPDTRLLAGGGVAFAFIPRQDAATPVDESLWVLRPPQSFPGVVIEEPVHNLRLIMAQR
jgi:GWxTD domain-containing protein